MMTEPTEFDWKAFEKMIGREVPLMLPDLPEKGDRSSTWISDYVQSILRQASAQAQEQATVSVPAPAAESKLDYELFQMKQTVICRIFLPAHTQPRDLRVWVRSHVLRVEGILHQKKRNLIRLPALVSVKRSSVFCEDGVLEVNMPKLAGQKFKELPIRF